MPDPVLRGKAAKEFKRRFLMGRTELDPEKAKRHKEDIEVYRTTKLVR